MTEAYSATLDHDNRSYVLAVPDLELFKCEACGNRILSDEAEDRLNAALREAAGLLAPSEIRGLRNRFQLTQPQFAERLGIAESTLSRWETGAQIQQRCWDKMLRAYADVPEFRSYLAGECGAERPARRSQAALASVTPSI